MDGFEKRWPLLLDLGEFPSVTSKGIQPLAGALTCVIMKRA